jgi:Flp pilus assembly protein TadD
VASRNGRAYRANTQGDRAASHFAKAAELKPGDSWVRYEWGNTLSEAGRFGEAASAYRAALEVDGKNIDPANR